MFGQVGIYQKCRLIVRMTIFEKIGSKINVCLNSGVTAVKIKPILENILISFILLDWIYHEEHNFQHAFILLAWVDVKQKRLSSRKYLKMFLLLWVYLICIS